MTTRILCEDRGRQCKWHENKCVHMGQRLYLAFHDKLEKRGKKNLALQIFYNSRPAQATMPYGPYGPSIINSNLFQGIKRGYPTGGYGQNHYGYGGYGASTGYGYDYKPSYGHGYGYGSGYGHQMGYGSGYKPTYNGYNQDYGYGDSYGYKSSYDGYSQDYGYGQSYGSGYGYKPYDGYKPHDDGYKPYDDGYKPKDDYKPYGKPQHGPYKPHGGYNSYEEQTYNEAGSTPTDPETYT